MRRIWTIGGVAHIQNAFQNYAANKPATAVLYFSIGNRATTLFRKMFVPVLLIAVFSRAATGFINYMTARNELYGMQKMLGVHLAEALQRELTLISRHLREQGELLASSPKVIQLLSGSISLLQETESSLPACGILPKPYRASARLLSWTRKARWLLSPHPWARACVAAIDATLKKSCKGVLGGKVYPLALSLGNVKLAWSDLLPAEIRKKMAKLQADIKKGAFKTDSKVLRYDFWMP